MLRGGRRSLTARSGPIRWTGRRWVTRPS